VLWKKVGPRTSAGRVQSVATRIVVDREKQRMAFRSANYWDILATLAVLTSADGPRTFNATLNALDGERVATGKDFEPTTGRPRSGVVHLDEDGARGLAARLAGRPFAVTRVEEKPYRRKPYAPFITSTLQQEAARKMRFSSAQTMRTAPAALRERLHHLYAYRLGEPLRVGHRRGPHPDPRPGTATRPSRRSPVATPRR